MTKQQNTPSRTFWTERQIAWAAGIQPNMVAKYLRVKPPKNLVSQNIETICGGKECP